MTTQLRKHTLSAILFMLSFITMDAFAQNDKPRESPPATASGKAGNKTITIQYSQPAVKNRDVWGKLVPYGQVWRTGANETTSIEFSDDVTIEGKPLAKGKYALFTIPNEKEWTIIFNKTIKWGAFSYKQEEDVLRVNVPVKKSKSFTERMTFTVSNQGLVSLKWENAQVGFTVK
ncbi:DUF2911 domain-containing protein [Cytophagaceae bacterium YF14B1]|uniref:DUF2911 domain-containing protein n=1 Tax=Xanthocytophaga flava TaxID=3048013 RepID=A0AAE3QMD1_9BACT|nr:DUF2911 domain-containing protein [Xanthocytophaga flavus]MDJ1482007.1 DUF2911 domain-containing protein [Xanthocytophaga flavus]